jgi:hypothetical protein
MALVKGPRKDHDSEVTKRSNVEYRREVANFKVILQAMYDVSIATSGRHVDLQRGWGSTLFTRLVGLGTSLRRLLPELAKSADESDYWDFSSVATISRVIVECCLLFYYLGVEKVGEEEWRDRLNLVHLHDCTARISMFRNLFDDEAQAEAFEVQRAELLARFEGSALLASKTPRQRKHLLKGDMVMFGIQDDVLKSLNEDRPKFRAWYEVLSSHAHSYPLAFHRMVDDERGKGVENNTEKNWTSMTLHFVSGFLARATTQMLSLFPDVEDPRLRGKIRK